MVWRCLPGIVILDIIVPVEQLVVVKLSALWDITANKALRSQHLVLVVL